MDDLPYSIHSFGVSKATCVNFDVRAGYRVSDGVSGLVEGLAGASHGSRNPGPEG